MIAIIDNYDSFTYNVVQRLGEIDASLNIRVFRNDRISVEELAELSPTHVIISPGPCTPDGAGISLEAASYFSGRLPLLGICLGHQSIGQASGGEIVRAEKLMHGKTDEIHHNGDGIFAGIESPMIATRYHSLIINPKTLSSKFETVAWAEDDGEQTIMAIQHEEHPTFGLQFHPESFLTEFGIDLLRNFLQLCTV